MEYHSSKHETSDDINDETIQYILYVPTHKKLHEISKRQENIIVIKVTWWIKDLYSKQTQLWNLSVRYTPYS